jgi:hypothetical protein
MSTKFGLHVTQGSRNRFGDVVAAAPAVVLAVGEGGALVEARDKSSGRTITIFREQTVYHDAPPGLDQMSEVQARQAAEQYWPQLVDRYRLNPADYYQAVNETGGDNPTSLRNIVAFEIRLMELAEADGYRLCVGNPAGGSPGSWELWVEHYVRLIRRAAQTMIQHQYCPTTSVSDIDRDVEMRGSSLYVEAACSAVRGDYPCQSLCLTTVTCYLSCTGRPAKATLFL